MLKYSRNSDKQDQELVVGTGTHLGGVVAKARAKVKHTNASEKVTVDVLSRQILEYGLSIGDTQGATMWVHKGADLELYSWPSYGSASSCQGVPRRGSVAGLARPMPRADSGGSGEGGLLCSCSTPC
jgi:hypothetical protein